MTSLLRPTTNRALQLRIHPRPANIGESREILRLITQKFGEVEHFRNLKYDQIPAPNTALVIFRTEEAAMRCAVASPVRFRMGRRVLGRDGGVEEGKREKEKEDGRGGASPAAATAAGAGAEQKTGPWGLGQARAMSTSSTRAAPSAQDGQPTARTGEAETSEHRLQHPESSAPNPNLTSLPSAASPTAPSSRGRAQQNHYNQRNQHAEPDQQGRIYQLFVNTARMNFRDRIASGHYHGSFTVNTARASQQDLADRVPLLGLSDVDLRAPEKPWRVMQRERERERGRTGRERRTLREVWEERRDVREMNAPLSEQVDGG